jgi:NAD(P)-dependent dehydrogenase (short-subunit alcohol dehydrogenase family)
MPIHSALTSGRVAVITGAASGIGVAAAKRFASFGMHVVLADLPGTALEHASHDVAEWPGAGSVIAIPTDVSDFASVQSLKTQANARFNIVCPDNDVTSAMGRKRIRWAAEDVIENRPPLSPAANARR